MYILVGRKIGRDTVPADSRVKLPPESEYDDRFTPSSPPSVGLSYCFIAFR